MSGTSITKFESDAEGKRCVTLRRSPLIITDGVEKKNEKNPLLKWRVPYGHFTVR